MTPHPTLTLAQVAMLRRIERGEQVSLSDAVLTRLATLKLVGMRTTTLALALTPAGRAAIAEQEKERD